MAVTLRFQTTGIVAGDGSPVVMRGPSLTIGRGPENDLVLPDPDRLISKNHCAIEDHGGNIVVIDFSTNGTFLNYSKAPLGRVMTPLNDGDVLSMGAYELVVSISSLRAPDPLASLPGPAAEGPVSHGLAERSARTADLLDDPAGGDFLDDLLGPENKPRGPGQIRRDEEIDPMMLPPLGADEDPLLPPRPEDPVQGASHASHSPSAHDHFSPRGSQRPVIPDDWDDDLLSPNERPTQNSPRPVAQPVPDLPPDAFEDLLADAPDATPSSPEPLAEEPEPLPAEPPAALETAAAAARAPTPEPETAAIPPASAKELVDVSQDAARAFLKGLGAEELQVADADMEETMARMGQMMRLMIEGLREILMTRTSIKSEFRINQTMISAGQNNPLKFSISAEQAIESMVRPARKGYLTSTVATEEALRDIKAHEVAMVTGMEAALKGVLARLDPKALETKIEGGGGISGLLKGKKARYWEVYEKLYGEISDQAENDFHDLFSKEFARAYQDQLEKLK